MKKNDTWTDTLIKNVGTEAAPVIKKYRVTHKCVSVKEGKRDRQGFIQYTDVTSEDRDLNDGKRYVVLSDNIAEVEFI